MLHRVLYVLCVEEYQGGDDVDGVMVQLQQHTTVIFVYTPPSQLQLLCVPTTQLQLVHSAAGGGSSLTDFHAYASEGPQQEHALLLNPAAPPPTARLHALLSNAAAAQLQLATGVARGATTLATSGQLQLGSQSSLLSSAVAMVSSGLLSGAGVSDAGEYFCSFNLYSSL